MGGLPRRHTAIEEQRSKGPTLTVEAGLSLTKPRRSPLAGAELEQRRIKAQLIAASWADAGIDAVALGGGDFILGTDFVRSLVTEHELPVVAANLVCGGEPPYPGHRVVERDGHRIGIVGVASGEIEGCEVGDAGEAIRAEVEAMPPVDLVLGLVPSENDRELAQWFGGGLPLDVALDARGRHAGAVPEQRGSTWVMGAGSRGKHVGVLQLSWVEGATGWAPENHVEAAQKKLDTASSRLKTLEARIPQATDDAARGRLEAQKAAYTKQVSDLQAQIASAGASGTHTLSVFEVPLSADVADHPATAARVAETKKAITTAGGGSPERFVPRAVVEGPYAGGQTCVACHKQEHAQWSRTGHARAWNGLVREERALDDDCWSCHVTGAGQDGGPRTAAESGPWRDVQCEACHGPARDHIAKPTEVLPTRDSGPEGCVGCHDGEQDGGRFDYPSYREKIVHGVDEASTAP